MSYTYPQALNALQGIAKDFMRILRPQDYAAVRLVSDIHSTTASVQWDNYGVTINLPVRPATSVMTQTEFEDWTAYLLHEMGHPTHTDLTTWKAACVAGLSRLTNAAEDVRMERALIKSGLVPNAKAVFSRLVSRKVAEARVNNWKPNSRKEIGWTLCVLGRVANGYAIDEHDVAWIKSQIKPGSTVETILAWALPELTACSSTRECMELAKRISDAIAQPTTPQDKQGEGEGEGEGKGEGDGEGEGEGEGEGDTSQKPAEGATDAPDAASATDSPEASKPTSDAAKASGKGGKSHGDGTCEADRSPAKPDGASTDDENPIGDETELSERELAPQSEAALTGDAAIQAHHVLEILRRGSLDAKPNADMLPQRKRPSYVPQMRDAAAKASRQRALLARALRANETDEREGGRKAGRLDRGALTRAAAGSSNVFARRDISEGYDTDVVILLDASGSMSSDMPKALEMGLIIAQAASSVGASCTTEIFNSQGYARAGTLASKHPPQIDDFAALVNSAVGGTPLSFQMARAAIAQAKRACGKRRVVFVVTDGGCDFGPAAVKGTAEYLEQTYGTVLAHVSIGNPLQGSFKAEVLVPYGKSVSEVGLEHFVKVLQAL